MAQSSADLHLAFLQDTFDSECLKDRRTPGEPESLSEKPHVKPHAQSACVKHPQHYYNQDKTL